LSSHRDFARVDGLGACSPCTIGCIAHGSIEAGPYWTEDPSGRVAWGLLQGEIGLLGVPR